MKKRIPLSQRVLPDYKKGEEIMNMVTHITGGALGIIVLIVSILKAITRQDAVGIVSVIIYGISMICLYTMSSVYHGLNTGTGKKVMQIIDHCTIYFLIAGTYTPILLCAVRRVSPVLAWGLLAVQWALALFAATLTAIDLKKYNVFSMICYILMGWSIIFFVSKTIAALSITGFTLTLAGGIVYTIGAILYGIGSKVHWMHSVFHIFVVIGSLLQFTAIYLFAI